MSSKRRPYGTQESLSQITRARVAGTGQGRVRATSPLPRTGGAVSGSTAALGTAGAGAGTITVRKNSSAVGTRGQVNLIEGTGVTLTVADDGTEIDVTIDASATDGCYVPLGDGDTSDPQYLFAADADPIYVTCAAAGL